jgi:hypothetical protein
MGENGLLDELRLPGGSHAQRNREHCPVAMNDVNSKE